MLSTDLMVKQEKPFDVKFLLGDKFLLLGVFAVAVYGITRLKK